MKCIQIQRQLDDLARERLAEPVAREIRQHLADCTDCRVQHQRQVRLQRLLALKRYEQPAPRYFDGVTAEFHGRLAALARRPSFWERVLAAVGLDSFHQPGYGWLAAGATAVIVCLAWVAWRNTSDSLQANNPPAPAPIVINVQAPSPFVSPDIRLTNPTRTVAAEPARAPSVELIAAGQSQPHPPRYVLDRIAITPASYEVADANF